MCVYTTYTHVLSYKDYTSMHIEIYAGDTLTILWSGLLLSHKKKQIIDSLLNPD